MKKSLFASILVISSISQAKVNFESLQHCLVSLRAHPKSTAFQIAPSPVSFITTLGEQQRQSQKANALVFRETIEGREHVHIVQDVNANRSGLFAGLRNSFSNTNPNIARTYIFENNQVANDCSSSNRSIIPIGGTCESHDQDGCRLGQLSFGVSRSGDQNKLCPNEISFADPVRNYRREQDIPATEMDSLVERAILTQIEYLQKNLPSEEMQYDRNNILRALSDNAYCAKAIEPQSASIVEKAQALVCHLAPTDTKRCSPAELLPSEDGTPVDSRG